MDEEEKERAKSCLNNIQDKLHSIYMELLSMAPYKPYILEKLKPIENDIKCLISMCTPTDDFDIDNDDLPF